jgi:chromobox protein 1
MWDDDGGIFKYRVKWEGYPKASDKTWEPLSYLDKAAAILQEYHDLVGYVPNPTNAKHRDWAGFRAELKKRKARSKRLEEKDALKPKPKLESNGSEVSKKRKLSMTEINVKHDDELEEIVDTPSKATVQYPPISSNWDDAILTITAIYYLDNHPTGEKELWGDLTWKNGQQQHTKHRVEVLRQRAPQKVSGFHQILVPTNACV